MTKIVNSADPFDAAWSANYIKIQIAKIKKMMEEYPGSETYEYCLKVWEERLAKYESRI